jgi:hypothetical protein
MFADIMIRTQWSIGDLLIAVIIIAACIGIVYVALRVFGVSIPAWAVQIFWIVVVACVAIFAIRLVLSL